MVTTPLITKIKSAGGTLYTFTSTSKDLTRVATNSSNYQFKFSHFACLNLPYIMEGNTSMMDYIYYVDNTLFKSVKSYIIEDIFRVEFELTDDISKHLKSCLVICTSHDKDKFVNKFTPVLKGSIFSTEIEGIVDNTNIVFQIQLTLDNDEVKTTRDLTYNIDYVGSAVEKGLYLEQFEGYKFQSNDYNISMAEHFQNYILNFESVILNEKDFDSDILRTPSERLFFNWLRKVGGIRFIESNKNQDHKLYIENVSSYGENTNQYLDRTVQYLGSIDAINQVDVNGDTFGEVYLYIPGSVGATPTINFRAITDNNYKNDIYKYGSEKIVGRENFKDEDKPIDDIRLDAIYDGDEGGNYYLGDEGYCIDFSNFDNIEKMNSESYHNFEFNCILIYYDLIKTNIEGEPEYATNLYGVLFLDNFKPDNISTTDKYLAHIDSLPKFRSSELDDGNAFALKLDLKIDTAPTTTMSRVPICGCTCNSTGDIYSDPNDSKGFALYSSALEQLHKCIDIFYTQQNEIYSLQDRIDKLESIILTLTDVSKIQNELDEINTRLNLNEIVDTQSIMNIVTDNTQKLNDIINGKYSTKLAFDTSTLKVGSGLNTINDDNNITIVNTQQDYKYIGKVSLNDGDNIPDESKENYIYMFNNIVNIKLMDFTNLVLLSENESDESDISLTEQLIFNIDTTDVQWKKGQSFKFIIYDDFKFNKIKHERLKIQTTIEGVNIIIKEFTKSDIQRLKSKSEIEIVCIDNMFNTNTENFIIFTR